MPKYIRIKDGVEVEMSEQAFGLLSPGAKKGYTLKSDAQDLAKSTVKDIVPEGIKINATGAEKAADILKEVFIEVGIEHNGESAVDDLAITAAASLRQAKLSVENLVNELKAAKQQYDDSNAAFAKLSKVADEVKEPAAETKTGDVNGSENTPPDNSKTEDKKPEDMTPKELKAKLDELQVPYNPAAPKPILVNLLNEKLNEGADKEQ